MLSVNPMTEPIDIEESRSKIKKAHEKVAALCAGRERWTMRIPADQRYDHDLVIDDGLCSGEKALDELEAARERIAEILPDHCYRCEKPCKYAGQEAKTGAARCAPCLLEDARERIEELEKSEEIRYRHRASLDRHLVESLKRIDDQAIQPILDTYFENEGEIGGKLDRSIPKAVADWIPKLIAERNQLRATVLVLQEHTDFCQEMARLGRNSDDVQFRQECLVRIQETAFHALEGENE